MSELAMSWLMDNLRHYAATRKARSMRAQNAMSHLGLITFYGLSADGLKLLTLACDLAAAQAQVQRVREALDGPPDAAPTLASLRGIAPGMTGDKDSVAFVREQRDGGEAKPGDA